MSKEGKKPPQEGWGFGKNNANIDLTQKEEKKQNIWEQNNEDLILIPDIDEEKQEKDLFQVSDTQGQPQAKVIDLYEMMKLIKYQTLPTPEEGVDISLLQTVMSSTEEIRESDEQWEFLKLKTEIYEIVTNMYATAANDEEEDQ